MVEISVSGMAIFGRLTPPKPTYLRSLEYFILYRFFYYALFAKLRKATISFVMSVRLAVRMQQLHSHRKKFHEI
jgi:hypothetical protein